MLWVFFMFNDLRWEVIACFVDIAWIDDHHCLNFLFIVQNKVFNKAQINIHIHVYPNFQNINICNFKYNISYYLKFLFLMLLFLMFILPNNYHYYIAYIDLIKCLENTHLPETMYLDLILSKPFQKQEVLNRLLHRHCKNLLHLKFLSIFRAEFQ